MGYGKESKGHEVEGSGISERGVENKTQYGGHGGEKAHQGDGLVVHLKVFSERRMAHNNGGHEDSGRHLGPEYGIDLADKPLPAAGGAEIRD